MTVDGKGAIAWQPTTAQLGTYQIGIRVSDGNAITTQTYQLAVTNNVINNNPTITSAPNLITNLERTYSYNLTATDKDGDELFWSLESAPAGMVIDGKTGALRWQPTVAQIGKHAINVRVTDMFGAYSGQEYTLTVNGINTPPLIQSTPNTIAGVGSQYQYQVVATDSEGDGISYKLDRYPTGMVIDASTGVINWTPNPTQVGNQTIEVAAIDAQGAVTKQVYQLVVGATAINQPPSITSQPSFVASIGSQYQYQVVAKDPENGQLSYTLKSAPSGMVIDASTGLITWDNPVVGNHQIVVTVRFFTIYRASFSSKA